MTDFLAELKMYFASFNEHDLEPDTDLFQTAVLDSLGIVQLITYVEQEYGVSIEVDEVTEENFQSIRAIVELIEGKLE